MAFLHPNPAGPLEPHKPDAIAGSVPIVLTTFAVIV